MALIRQRAEEIGATVRYAATSPQGGTTVLVRLARPDTGTVRENDRSARRARGAPAGP